MADIPKVVSARLRAAASFDTPLAAAHPSAEMLAAFAEQALSVPEREQMLGHLALCAGCREVMAFSMPNAPVADAYPLQGDFRVEGRSKDEGQSKEDRSKYGGSLSPDAAGKNWWFGFARPNLGWAALAAGVAVAASMLVLHPLQQRQAAETASKQAVVTAQIPAAADSGMGQASSEPSESKTVASLKSKPALSGETRKSHEGVLTARNVAPIEKAKPVLGGEEALEAGNQPASVHNPQTQLRFEIADGVLSRSADGGENWQSVLHSDQPLQCYASHDREVWAGGQRGTLFHSEDAGLTWAKVQISTYDEAPDSDIAQIHFRWNGPSGAKEIVVSNKAMETWSSLDGGASWRKK
jgi:hypothetical protein